jgi:hypothetical protein
MNTIQPVIDAILRDIRALPRHRNDEQRNYFDVGARELEHILLERLPMLEPEDAIAVQLRRLNDNLESGFEVLPTNGGTFLVRFRS